MEAADCCFCSSRVSSVSNSSRRQICKYCYEKNRRLILLVDDSGRANPSVGKIAGAYGDPDILVKPGRGDGPAIPAHRAVLAAKSVIFRKMLDSDGCKAPPSDSITLPEMCHEQLEAFLEFLYSGQLSGEKVERNAIPLLRAAYKYDISCLEGLCEQAMIRCLNRHSVWYFLDIADTFEKETLRNAALDYIKSNATAVFSVGFDYLMHESPDLALEITRVLVKHLAGN